MPNLIKCCSVCQHYHIGARIAGVCRADGDVRVDGIRRDGSAITLLICGCTGLGHFARIEQREADADGGDTPR